MPFELKIKDNYLRRISLLILTCQEKIYFMRVPKLKRIHISPTKTKFLGTRAPLTQIGDLQNWQHRELRLSKR